MSIEFVCDNCGQQMQVPNEKAGKSGKCPACGEHITVPSSEDDFLSEGFSLYDKPAGAENGGKKPCPMCGEMIAAAARKCRFCGEQLGASIRDEELDQLVDERIKSKQASSTAIQIFITGLIGCLSPVIAIYGIVFLIRHPESFPRKTLAIVGTVLHCIWTVILLLLVAAGEM
jgi:predicted RNA-binding Zn-ribbon protein involved in translation (DUF1610 family)